MRQKKLFKEFGINSTKHKQWKNRLVSVGEGCYNNRPYNINVLNKDENFAETKALIYVFYNEIFLSKSLTAYSENISDINK